MHDSGVYDIKRKKMTFKIYWFWWHSVSGCIFISMLSIVSAWGRSGITWR